MKASKKNKTQDSLFRSLNMRVKKWELLPKGEVAKPGMYVGFNTYDAYYDKGDKVSEGFLISLRPGAEGPTLLVAPTGPDLVGIISLGDLYPVDFKCVVWMDNHREFDVHTLLTHTNQHIRRLAKGMYDTDSE